MNQDILLGEIKQQPDAIERLIKNEKNNIRKIRNRIVNSFNYIIIAARGSSDNAARFGQYIFGESNCIQVALATPSLYTLYKRPPQMTGALVIGISQSGQSPDIVTVLEEAKKQGCTTLGITNDVHSPLANTSDFIIPISVHEEIATAATKSYTTSLAALAMLSCSLNDDKEGFEDLEKIPDAMHQTILKSTNEIANIQRYRYMEHCVVIGRGFNYATAFEIALKIKELTKVVAVPYSSADFRHGPIAAVDRGFPIIFIAHSGKTLADIFEIKQNLLNLGAELITISDHKKVCKDSKLIFLLPSGIPEWLSPLVNVLPGQLFARQLALEKGLDPDHPVGLTKVTETF